MSSSPKVLFIQTAFVGDLLLSIPTLRVIREKNPSAQLTLLCRKGLGDFMRSCEVVNEVIEADKSSNQSWSSVEAQLTSQNWDLIICPHQSPRSLLLVRKLRARKRIGYRSLLGKIVFDEAIERPMHLPEALRQLVLLPSQRTEEVLSFEPLGNKNIFRRFPKVTDEKSLTMTEALKSVPQWASMQVEALKSSKENLVILAPGSVWATKKWTEEGFAEVALHFSAKGNVVELVGAPDEREVCERVRSLAIAKNHSLSEKIINMAGKNSLWQSAQRMARAKLVVTNDSGAMHMAACAGTPSVSAFGPTVLEQGYRPWQTQARVVHRVLSCRPCGKHGAKKCPIGTHECMKMIEAKDMITAAGELQ